MVRSYKRWLSSSFSTSAARRQRASETMSPISILAFRLAMSCPMWEWIKSALEREEIRQECYVDIDLDAMPKELAERGGRGA